MKNRDSSTKKFFQVKKNELCGFVTEFKNEHWWQCFPISRGKYPFVIEVPYGVTVIKGNAFAGLKSGLNGDICVVLPSGVQEIEKNAFSGCEISKLIISDTVSKISPDAFRLAKIGEIEVDKANLAYKSEGGCLYNYEMSQLLRYAGNHTDYTVASSVSVIGKRAFENTQNLECIYIPDTVTTIQDGAFYNSGIKSVSGASSVTSIGQHVFALCKRLHSFAMPFGVTYVNHRLFYSCESLESITLSKDTKQIGEESFYLCTSLAKIELPEEVRAIGKSAFEGCRALRTAELPKRVTAIEDSTFKGCGFSEFVVGDTITKIGKEAFADCKRLKFVTVGASVNEMDERVFFGCDKKMIVAIRGKEKGDKLPYNKRWNEISCTMLNKKLKNVAYVSEKGDIKKYM